jgi:hypothetical protein
MKEFFKNPYTFFLSLIGYEIQKPSPILKSMVRVTHSNWLQSIQDNGTFKDYEYNLYTN